MKFRFVYTLTLFDDAKISKVEKKSLTFHCHSQCNCQLLALRYHIFYFHVKEFIRDFDSSKLSKFILEKRHLLKVGLIAEFCIVSNKYEFNNSCSFNLKSKKDSQ